MFTKGDFWLLCKRSFCAVLISLSESSFVRLSSSDERYRFLTNSFAYSVIWFFFCLASFPLLAKLPDPCDPTVLLASPISVESSIHIEPTPIERFERSEALTFLFRLFEGIACMQIDRVITSSPSCMVCWPLSSVSSGGIYFAESSAWLFSAK